jgi:hypothetical protein
VLNGSGIAGVAGTAASALTSRGFHVAGTGDAGSYTYTKSIIEYTSASELPAVTTLKQQIPSATVRKIPGLVPGTLALIIGSSFTTLAAQPSPAPTHHGKAPSVGSLATKYGGITGGASCKSDAGAFSGPLSPAG